MNDETQSDAKPAAPTDPFGPAHVGFVATIEFLHGLRAAGGGLIESAIQVAAFAAVNSAGGEQQEQ